MPRRGDQARHRIESRHVAEAQRDYAKSWPNITQKKEAPADAKEWDGKSGKLEAYFSPNPGSGD